MTRKDYRIIADAIRGQFEDLGVGPIHAAERAAVARTARAIARTLHANSSLTPNGNRSFDEERFLKEAGVR